MRKIIVGVIITGLVIPMMSGCDFIGVAFRAELSELEGIWQMVDGDGASFDFSYLEINSEGRLRSWYPQGLSEELQLRRQDNGVFRVEVLKHPYSPFADIGDYNIDFRLRRGELQTIWYPDDPDLWDAWAPSFEEAVALPEGSYTHDFENGSTGFVRPHGPDGSPEWETFSDDGNTVLKPVRNDENADADILIAPGDQFTVEFSAKRFETDSPESGKSWFAFDLLTGNMVREGEDSEAQVSKWFSSNDLGAITLGNRNDAFTEEVYVYDATPSTGDKHLFTIVVTSVPEVASTIELLVDGVSVGSRTVAYGFVEQLKIEGHPDTGLWYFDDLEVTWSP